MSECPYEKRPGIPKEKNCIKSSTARINEIESLLDKQNTEAKSNFWKIVT